MVSYRQATKEDIQILQDLNNEVFVDNSKYDPDIIADWAYTDDGREYFSKTVSDTNNYCLIAEVNGRPVGYIAGAPKYLSYVKSKYFEIENMGTIPTYRSKGIGSQLIQKCIDWAKQHGYQKIYVNSYFKNEEAISFYNHNGFNEYDLGLLKEL